MNKLQLSYTGDHKVYLIYLINYQQLHIKIHLYVYYIIQADFFVFVSTGIWRTIRNTNSVKCTK